MPRGELLLEILDVVELEDDFARARVADALDHGGVVQAVGEDHAVGHLAAEGGEGGIVGHVAGGEHQGRVLGVELGYGLFELHGVSVVARYLSTRETCRSNVVTCMRRKHSLT